MFGSKRLKICLTHQTSTLFPIRIPFFLEVQFYSQRQEIEIQGKKTYCGTMNTTTIEGKKKHTNSTPNRIPTQLIEISRNKNPIKKMHIYTNIKTILFLMNQHKDYPGKKTSLQRFFYSSPSIYPNNGPQKNIAKNNFWNTSQVAYPLLKDQISIIVRE